MSEQLQPVTPLAGVVGAEGLACRIEEVGPLGMISLQGDFSSAALRNAATAIGGVDFPELRKITRDGDRGMAWMSPDELMIFCPRAEVAPALVSIADTMKDEHYQAVDVSDARCSSKSRIKSKPSSPPSNARCGSC